MQITLYPHRNGGGGFDNDKPQHIDKTFSEICDFLMKDCKEADKTARGAFLGGFDRGGKTNQSITSRTLVTIDLDDLQGTTQDEAFRVIRERLAAYELFAYTTYKSNPDAPRIRILMPLRSELTANNSKYDFFDAYEATVRMVGLLLQKPWIDISSARVAQCMYLPLRRPDGPEIATYYNSGETVLPVTEKAQIREIRASYEKAFPQQIPQAKKNGEKATTIQNPLEKKGWVGAFCRTYRINEAIEKFCSEYYAPDRNGRYTWVDGSGSMGINPAYQDGTVAYCFQTTSPISDGHAHNAFDLVRLTLFRGLDAGQHANTKPENLNSYKAMIDLCEKDPDVKQQYEADRAQDLREKFNFEDLPENSMESADWSWMEELRTTGKKDDTPDTNPHNIKLMLENLPTLKGRIRYDEFSHKKIAEDLPWRKEKKPWEDSDTARLRIYLDKLMGNAAKKEVIIDAVETVALDNKYDAYMDYVNNLPKWDGVPRVDTLLIDYLGAEDDPAGYTRMVTRKHMMAHIARALVPGCKYETMLILNGPQECGKTSFVGNIAPNPEWYQNEMPPLRDKDKDSQLLLVGKAVVENAELKGYTKSDQEANKIQYSKQWDDVRKPYGRETERYLRRCVFWGTTNQNEFLRDSTGERRYWPVDCAKQKPTKYPLIDLPLERDQIWAEALTYYKNKEPLYLETQEQKELLKSIQMNFKETDPELLQAIDFLKTEIPLPEIWSTLSKSQKQMYFAGNLITGGNSVLTEDVPAITATAPRETITPRELWCECFGKEEGDYKRPDNRRMQEILNNVPGWERVASRKRISGYKVSMDGCYYRAIHNDDTNIEDLL